MSYYQPFGVFRDNGQEPVWRASVATLEEAKFLAQKFADNEGQEFFIYDFNGFSEVARMFPSRREPNA